MLSSLYLTGATLLLAATAAQAAPTNNQNQTLPPINLGYFSYPHGNHFVAWSPFTPTTTQEVAEVCDTYGAIRGTATWTSIRAYDTYVRKPICRNPFNITDDATGTTYTNLELACADDDIPLYMDPVVTAVVDVASNRTVEACAAVPTDSPAGTYASCTKAPYQGVRFSFACTAV